MPGPIWENQFDGAQDDLEEFARTPWQEIQYDQGIFWAYFHDLTYEELQPDLFLHAFPICMAMWRHTLMHDTDCDAGDAGFHRALHRSDHVWNMVSEAQRVAVINYFIEGLLERMDAEPLGHPSEPRHFWWLYRLNSLAKVMPLALELFPTWFRCETPGRAMCATEWLWLLTYSSEGWSTLESMVEEDGSIWDAAWRSENLGFLAEYMTAERLYSVAETGAQRLQGTVAANIAAEVGEITELYPKFVQRRITELLAALAVPLRPLNEHWWSPRISATDP